MVASWRPDLAVQVAFNADPNDPSFLPVWSDLTSLFLNAGLMKRGRQYELDQNQASQPSITWLDPNEYLNQANTSSPYWPGVVPLRQLLIQATWANPAAGNLLNTGQGASSILGTTSAGYDPSFESYTAAASVPWLTAVGATVPVVTATNPFQGTKDVTWTVAATSVAQGVSWVCPCVPGQQYTITAHVRQSTGSTQALRIADQTAIVDNFERTVTGGWGTALYGSAWTTIITPATPYTVSPGVGAMLLSGSGAEQQVNGSVTTWRDVDIVAYVTTDQASTGTSGYERAMLVARYVDFNNRYTATLDFNTDTTITLRIVKRVAGVDSTLVSTVLSSIYTAGDVWGFRFNIVGTTLSASAWPQYTPEPTTYNITTTDTAYTVGAIGAAALMSASSTNTNVTMSWQNFSASGSQNLTTTTTSGSYVTMSGTFTATQPTHTITAATQGAVTAGTINIDAIQLEPGASASTFTTTGSTIYGLFRGFVERWPSQWDYEGYMGVVDSTGVDAFEALNLYTLTAEYYNALLTTQPVLYWPLNDQAGSTTYGEQSGNNGQPLKNIVSKYGAGTAPTAGTAMNIFGDPGGTGVTFTPDSAHYSGGLQHATIIGFGNNGSNPSTVWPPGGSQPSYETTVAFWVTASPLAALVYSMYPFSYSQPIGSGDALQVEIEYPAFNPVVTITGVAGSVGAVGTTDVADGLPHLVICTMSQALGGNTTMKIYVDGSLEDSQTAATNTTGYPPSTGGLTNLDVGGWFATTTGNQQVLNGSLAHVTLWTRVLTATEVTALWNAGQGDTGETSGARITRYVGEAWHGLTNIDTGSSLMGVSTVTTGTPVLAACQAVTVTEQGEFWVDKDGQVAFTGRSARYLNLTSRWTFGENTAGGEYPYQGNIRYDFDPTFVYNVVTVNNSDGVTATVQVKGSQQEFFPRSVSVDVDTSTDDAAIQLAYWIANTHQQPQQRVETIVLDPAAYPLLWPVILVMEIGDRVTVKRRATAGNAKAGLTMSADFFIEAISHDAINMLGAWTVTLLLSPVADSANVFILDDTTWGVLDGPGLLAY